MAAHVAHYEGFADRGLLTAIGTFERPEVNGSMCVLTTREAAEEFAAADPFVVHGVVKVLPGARVDGRAGLSVSG